MSNQFRADQIIGKSLVAREPVNIYRVPDDNATPVYFVRSGETVGTVTSYLNPGPGRNTLYWVFRDVNGRNYYTQHRPGMYDVPSLQSQGALTTAEELQAEQEKNKTTAEKIFTKAQNLLLIGALVYLAAQIIRAKRVNA